MNPSGSPGGFFYEPNFIAAIKLLLPVRTGTGGRRTLLRSVILIIKTTTNLRIFKQLLNA